MPASLEADEFADAPGQRNDAHAVADMQSRLAWRITILAIAAFPAMMLLMLLSEGGFVEYVLAPLTTRVDSEPLFSVVMATFLFATFGAAGYAVWLARKARAVGDDGTRRRTTRVMVLAIPFALGVGAVGLLMILQFVLNPLL
jgi:hypothetical protein